MKKLLLLIPIIFVSCSKNQLYVTEISSPNSNGCTTWIFKAGTKSPIANGWYTPCGSTTETTITLKAGESLSVCLINPNDKGKGLTGEGSTITYKSECLK